MKRKRTRGVCVCNTRSIKKNNINTSFIYCSKKVYTINNKIEKEEIVVFKHYI